MKSRSKHCLHQIIRRELGVPSPFVTSINTLRNVLFGPKRTFRCVLTRKENSLVGQSGNYVWVTLPHQANRSSAESEMLQVCSDGRVLSLFSVPCDPRPKDIFFYYIPDPVWTTKVSFKEYQPQFFVLRKGSLLSRYDLKRGIKYNEDYLGPHSMTSMTWIAVQNLLVIKSEKIKRLENVNHLIYFCIYCLHPYKLHSNFYIDGEVFPAMNDRKQYGRLRNVEIQEGLLLVMTERNFILVYSSDAILELPVNPVTGHIAVRFTPPLLFVTFAHQDILNIGACPWAYIKSVSDSLLEVRDLGTNHLVENGNVTWIGSTYQQISPDYLSFHDDDSSRLIHTKSNDLRVLSLKENNGKRILEQEFQYSDHNMISKKQDKLVSRFGRLIKSKYIWDDSMNVALSYDVEDELKILVILEARRDMEMSSTRLVKVTFFESVTYEVLSTLMINKYVEGDIETNRMSVSLDRDMLSISSICGSQRTMFYFLTEEFCAGKKNCLEIKKQQKKRTNKLNCSRNLRSSAMQI